MNDDNLRDVVREVAKNGGFGQCGTGNTRQGRRQTAALRRARDLGLVSYEQGCWSKIKKIIIKFRPCIVISFISFPLFNTINKEKAFSQTG